MGLRQVRDINNGRFGEDTNIVIVTHGLTLRIFLARWFHWPISEYEEVYNPGNCVPLVLVRRAAEEEMEARRRRARPASAPCCRSRAACAARAARGSRAHTTGGCCLRTRRGARPGGGAGNKHQQQELCSIESAYCDPSGERHVKDLYRLTPESLAQLAGATPRMAEMMLPERESAWTRTLTVADLSASCDILSEEEADNW